MPVDTSRLEVATQPRMVAGGYAQLPFVTPTSLRAFLNAEAPKKFNEKAKVKFIDCQSSKDNCGKQFRGALHMNFNTAAGEAIPRFKTVIKEANAVYEDLGDADVVIVYCVYGQSRSPAIASLYMNATASPDTRPLKLKAGQRVLVLDGGMTAFQNLTPPPVQIIGWMNVAKPAKQPSAVLIPQPGGDTEEVIDALYPDPV